MMYNPKDNIVMAEGNGGFKILAEEVVLPKTVIAPSADKLLNDLIIKDTTKEAEKELNNEIEKLQKRLTWLNTLKELYQNIEKYEKPKL